MIRVAPRFLVMGGGLIPGIKEKKKKGFCNEILVTRKNDVAIFL